MSKKKKSPSFCNDLAFCLMMIQKNNSLFKRHAVNGSGDFK